MKSKVNQWKKLKVQSSLWFNFETLNSKKPRSRENQLLLSKKVNLSSDLYGKIECTCVGTKTPRFPEIKLNPGFWGFDPLPALIHNSGFGAITREL